MNKQIVLIFLIILFVCSSACSKEEEQGFTDGLFVTAYFETYAYLTEQIELPEGIDAIRRVWVDDGRIYFYYILFDTEHNSKPVVVSLFPNGDDLIVREFPNGSVGYEQFQREFGLYQYNLEHLAPYGSRTTLSDGRLVGLLYDRSGNPSLREIDAAGGDWGNETYQITAPGAIRLFPAKENADYDLLIDDGRSIFGYHLQTGKRTLILDWVETGFSDMQGAHVLFLSDECVIVLLQSMGWDGDNITYDTEMFVLTRVLRAELPERVTLILGGFSLSQNIIDAVVAFNRSNNSISIQIHDYSMYATQEDERAGFFRFQMDIIQGIGPDILYNANEVMAASGLLADLYPFLDADTELSRFDFFPNVLRAMEAPDGSLPSITDRFGIITMIGQAEKYGHIESFTTYELLSLLETPVPYPLGFWMTSESFIMSMFNSYINWQTFEASFDSDAFIQLLNASVQLPISAPDTVVGIVPSDYTLILRGEQILSIAQLFDTLDYQLYTAALGEIKVLGVPTEKGGVHRLLLSTRIGINSVSEHKDEAWEFIRRLILPTAQIDHYFPLRVDLYEEMVALAMTPAENPRQAYTSDSVIEIFAMTAEEVHDLRAIIESAQLDSHSDYALWLIALENLHSFFAGSATAEDTARIIQNRIQTYLSERELARE